MPELTYHPFLKGIQLPLPLKAALYRRGFKSEQEVNDYLFPKTLPNPFDHFSDLDKATQRLKKACEESEKIAICGDYDADGMTSTAMLMRGLKEMGANPKSFIPNREYDGYGLNKNMVDEINNQEIRIIITVDNGVSAIEALELARKYNIDVILTDHHTLPNDELKVFALIHPSRTPIGSPYRVMAGVGLAFVVISALGGMLGSNNTQTISIELFIIGTIADMAQLRDANRTIINCNLKNLKQAKCQGIIELMKFSSPPHQGLISEYIGFHLAPRINAVGRIGDPSMIIDLFTTNSPEKAYKIAEECNSLNNDRKDLTKKIESEAISILESEFTALPPFILLAQNHWHIGVIGIVASRIMDRYNRPTAILGADKDSFFRGSVRSPGTIQIDKALDYCSDLLVSFGGHKAAGGFTVRPNNISKLHTKLQCYANSKLENNSYIKHIYPESLLQFCDINQQLWEGIRLLEPFGLGNQMPIFWSNKCKVINTRTLRGGHLNLLLSQGSHKVSAIWWNHDKVDFKGDYIDIAFTLRINEYKSKADLQLDIISARAHLPLIKLKAGELNYVVYPIGKNKFALENNKKDRVIAYINEENKLVSNDIRAKDPFVNEILLRGAQALGLYI